MNNNNNSAYTVTLVVVGGLGFEFCVFVAGWRHALRSEWPFIIIIIMSRIEDRRNLQPPMQYTYWILDPGL